MKEVKKKRKEFNQICRDIKSIKIQGARNIAKKALYAYYLFPTEESRKKLISLRPTEPMLVNVLEKTKHLTKKEILNHFDEAQNKINKSILKLIDDGDVIQTICHSTNVINALIYAKKKGKKFEVYNTETRPLFQGRKTARQLRSSGIKVTMFIDSAMDIALSKKSDTKKVSKVLIGADAILKKGVINKVGSGMLAKLAKLEKIPLYIVADSWKHTRKIIKIEERDFHEVWKKVPKNSLIKIRNPAFEFVKKKYIKGIISEFGLRGYNEFLKIVNKN